MSKAAKRGSRLSPGPRRRWPRARARSRPSRRQQHGRQECHVQHRSPSTVPSGHSVKSVVRGGRTQRRKQPAGGATVPAFNLAGAQLAFKSTGCVSVLNISPAIGIAAYRRAGPIVAVGTMRKMRGWSGRPFRPRPVTGQAIRPPDNGRISLFPVRPAMPAHDGPSVADR